MNARPGTPADVVVHSVEPRAYTGPSGERGLAAITARLDHLESLGVTHVWVLPFHPSGGRDGGYDVVDHAAVDPRLGTMDDFTELVRAAGERGIGILVDLVTHHTSSDHRWFREARRHPSSRRGRYYVWTHDPDSEPHMEPMFSTEDSVWEFDAEAGAWYRHAFFSHQPDLDHSNPDVVDEVERVMRFWLGQGASGFRLDALPLTAQQYRVRGEDSAHLLRRLRRVLEEERPGGVLLAETNVAADELPAYFDEGRGITHALSFWLTDHVFLALARQEAEPVLRGFGALAPAPAGTTYANFLRNHDELALEHLAVDERTEVLDTLAPDPAQRALDGARLRLHSLLGDLRRSAMAQVLLLALPGAPVMLYGDELGVVEDLDLPGRRAVRVPVPWGAVEDPEVAWLVDVVAQGVRARRALYGTDPGTVVDAPAPEVVRVRLTRGCDAELLANLADHQVDFAAAHSDVGVWGRVLLEDGRSAVDGGAVQLAPYGFLWRAR